MYYDRLKSRVRASSIAKQQQMEARALLDNIDVKRHIAPCYLPLHEDIKAGQHRFYNLPGGRGSLQTTNTKRTKTAICFPLSPTGTTTV